MGIMSLLKLVLLMGKKVIIIPTYNEAQNIASIIRQVRVYDKDSSILVVDDSSPDGTADIVTGMMTNDSKISLLLRKGKEGLGKAYLHAFKEVLMKNKTEWIQTLDADFSHDPKYLPAMSKASNDADVVIGSRYVAGGGTSGWVFWRRLLSKFANFYCKVITGMPVSDTTAGFYLMRTKFMREAGLDNITSNGHAFQMELKYRLWKKGARMVEIPVVLPDRNLGKSKMSKGVIGEAVWAPWKMRLNKLI